MKLDLTEKELAALKKALDVLDELPSYIGNFGVDPYQYDRVKAKLNDWKLPNKADYE